MIDRPVALSGELDPALFGGKAAQLASLIAAGLPVPEGLALAWPFVDRIAAGDPAGEEVLAAAWARLSAPVAVRSSAVGEDSGDASFAGVHSTMLNVLDAPGLIMAVREVHASGSSVAALAYRSAMTRRSASGQVADPRVGVVVQRLLEPEISGVLFTRHPVTGADERVVEATWGLGEALVGGLVTPDHVRVSRQGTVIEERIGEKDLLVRARISGGIEEAPVDAELVNAPCLDPERLRALLDLAERCEALAGPGLDLEWCIAGGRLHLLQQRPMTT